MNKKITDMRIQKEVQSIAKQPIPSVILQRDGHLTFHFCFYHLQEQYTQGFYHGVLELPADYPFSPPKIVFKTNNGRFEVGKSICTTFTHYHAETWSSSWNIRTILTAMISFMYSSERGIGGVFETPHRRKHLAAKSLQENLKNEKFVELFKEKLIELKLVTPEHIFELMNRSEKGKHRKRVQSEKTNVDQIRDTQELPFQLEAIEEKACDDLKNKQIVVAFEEGPLMVNTQIEEKGDEEMKEIDELKMLKKKRKLQFNEFYIQDMRIERQNTVQDDQQA